MECPICYEPINLLYETPCHHKFCYLCLKTAYLNQNLKCPLCRANLPADLCENAKLTEKISIPNVVWTYSGRHGGMWYYDINSNELIEAGYQNFLNDSTQNTINLTILNKPYVINFDTMVQKGPYGSREIQRLDIATSEDIKGMAGLRLTN